MTTAGLDKIDTDLVKKEKEKKKRKRKRKKKKKQRKKEGSCLKSNISAAK